LSKDEIDTLNRLTVIFLETAELRVKDRKDINLTFWRNNVDRMLEFNDKTVLKDSGSVTHKQMEEKVKSIYDAFDERRKLTEAKDADLEDLKLLESKIKKNKK
tara:strand:- start:1251 stop:1559 length:309 start_codon:yes stop_codon:yes gene_type:complete